MNVHYVNDMLVASVSHNAIVDVCRRCHELLFYYFENYNSNNFKIYHNVALNSLSILARNYVISTSGAQFGSPFLDNGSIDLEGV